MPSHSIRVVTFDADGTIWDFATTMREALVASLQSIQTLYPEEAAGISVSDLIAHRQEAEAAFKGKSMTMEALRFAGFMRTLDAIGIRDEHFAHDLVTSYLEHRFANARIFDDALPALDRLRGQFRLGLLTNGNSYPDKLGVGDRFEFSIIAQEHGVSKPDPEFYELAIRTAGVHPDEILHVGDSIDNDVLPARRAGMRAVWVNRAGHDPPRGRQSLATIYSLDELPAFLGM
jgi:putative hydrolase of the HAD superfamily